MLRPRLKALCEVLRVSDIAALAPTGPGEEVHTVALQDKAAVQALLQGVFAVVHLGGISTESAFEDMVPANIVGTYHVYEAARLQGVRRILFASSDHVTGFYSQGQTVHSQVPMRPNSYSGVSKAFGESLAQFYLDKA